jgi:ABC-2 type transport system ATP-binding protein
MEEADELCGRVAFMDGGRIVALDTPSRLKVEHGDKMLHVMFQDGKAAVLPLDQPGSADQIAEWTRQGQILTMHTGEATLGEVFLQLTGRRLSE